MIRQAKWRGTAMVRYLKCKNKDCGKEYNVSLLQQIPSTGYECQSCEKKRRLNRIAVPLSR